MHTSNKKLREWEELVRSTGCCVTGATNGVQIHHVKGRTYKHNKVHIGGVYILPLHESVHMVTGSHPNAYHKNKHGFIEEFGLPSFLWVEVLRRVEEHTDTNQYVSTDQYDAIRDLDI